MDYSESNLAKMFSVSTLRLVHENDVAKAAATLFSNRSRYEAVEAETEIPWTMIGVIHGLESSFNFEKHLHNGDTLSARTVHVPVGRPVAGEPPFTWEQSAEDALSKVWRPSSWNMGSALHFLEMYNGLGYRIHNIYSPYVWSFTSAYTSGKFVADRSFDPDAVSEEAGAAAILKALEKLGVTLV